MTDPTPTIPPAEIRKLAADLGGVMKLALAVGVSYYAAYSWTRDTRKPGGPAVLRMRELQREQGEVKP